jgi:hypothetical protein
MRFTDRNGQAITVNNFSGNLIYKKATAVEYGKPLHGWIMFSTTKDLYTQEINRYKLVCIDAYKKRHTFETSTTDLENINLLLDLAEMTIGPGALNVQSTTSAGARSG